MILEAIVGAALVGQFIYHRLTESPPPKPKDRIRIPAIEEGTTIPLLFGRCRVRKPFIPWYGNSTATQRPSQPDGLFVYQIDVLFVLGIPFPDGNVYLQAVYIDDHAVSDASINNFSANLGGTRGLLDNNNLVDVDGPQWTGCQFEFGDGRSTQTMDASTTAGAMIVAGVDSTLIPGFRGYVTFLAYHLDRNTPSLPAFSFEVSSYPADFLDREDVGYDANPADVIRSIIIGQFAKLGIDAGFIDYDSFYAAAVTLREENHGYSMAIEDASTAGDIIQDILRQIDAVLYEDPTTGAIKIKLIRQDWDEDDCLEITTDNCEGLYDFAAGGWSGLVNKIRVVFTNRDDDYADGSATAQNPANFVGENGQVNDSVLSFPGCCKQTTADEIASRELNFLSRPVTKCRAVVDRTFLRTVPGDVVKLTWPEYGIDGMFLRVGSVNRGELAQGKITLMLIQDAGYVWRGEGPVTNDENAIFVPPFPGILAV